MQRARAVTALLLLAAVACRDPERSVAPAATRGALDGPTTPLVVEAESPIARLVVTIDDGFGARETALSREAKEGPLVGAIEVAAGTKARVAFRAYDLEGSLTHESEGTLVTGSELTPQQEFQMQPGHGGGPATVRIGTYRLAMMVPEIVGVPGKENRFDAVLLDARGERHPFTKEGAQWVPMGPQDGLGRAGFDLEDYILHILWIPEKWYVGRMKFCTIGDRVCGTIFVKDPNPVVQLVVGNSHACALRRSGVTTCFGDWVLAQNGFEHGVSQIAPIPFASLGGTAGDHTCGVDRSGRVYCWGRASSHQLGNATLSAGQGYPELVALPDTAVQVTAGGQHSCALLANGQAWCWGKNDRGQLGDGSAASASPVASTHIAVRVLNAPALVAISAGANHTCGLSAAGVAWCWGDNGVGQSGVAAASSDLCGSYLCLATARPVQTSVRPIKYPLTFAGIEAGSYATCAWTSAGTGYCWGTPEGSFTYNGGFNHVPRTPTSQPAWKRLVAGNGFQCGIDGGDMAQCFGANVMGQTGTGASSATPVASPTPVALTDTWLIVDGGGGHACGLRAKGYVISCWGNNHDGELGLGTMGGSRSTPVNVTEPY